MKKFLTVLAALLLGLSACATPDFPELTETQPELFMQPRKSEQTAPDTAAPDYDLAYYNTRNYTTIAGVWISYIELSGILTNRTEEQFRSGFADMMNNCRSLGINTVYVHLRPFGDALYSSDYYPWSKYVTGRVGGVPEYDPLTVMLEEAHSRDISFHGWLNPMRIQADADIADVSDTFAIGKWYKSEKLRKTYIVKHNENWYLNPAHEEVRALIGDGAEEITAKYNIDGLHIDDYFYPTTSPDFDALSFAAISAPKSLSAFRRANVNAMVRELYTSVKRGNPNALFGISPSGDFSLNADELYADVHAWAGGGFADYIVPQLYYGFNNESLPFAEYAARWQDLYAESSVKLMYGLAVYKIGAADKFAGTGEREWLDEREIIRRQIEAVRAAPGYGGVVFFSYNFLFNPTHVTEAIIAEIVAFKPLLND
ncbi:MAG: family 10 glycosylhydrolase [Oscillospiraceae bacterium]|nr:family 10 glycosylhydrolase [Oscillospiraceae bacterium]